MHRLRGLTVIAVLINDNHTDIRFVTNEGPKDYYAEGDCCSESWINHISGLDVLLGQPIQQVEEIDLHSLEFGDPDFHDRQEVERLYSIKLSTPKGIFEIDFRNASNGYYGGELRPGLIGEESDLKPLTEDF